MLPFLWEFLEFIVILSACLAGLEGRPVDSSSRGLGCDLQWKKLIQKQSSGSTRGLTGNYAKLGMTVADPSTNHELPIHNEYGSGFLILPSYKM